MRLVSERSPLGQLLKELTPPESVEGAEVEPAEETPEDPPEVKKGQPELELAVTKATDMERRRTVGPLYAPGTADAHGEFATAGDLEDAVAKYLEGGDLNLRLQHNRSKIGGKVIGIMAWPYETEAQLTLPGDDTVTKSVKLPAGTVYVATEWSPSAWEDVKKGKLTGYSLGGRALRVRGVSLPEPSAAA